MNSPTARALSPTTLRGWRARAWTWVLFVALLRALVPHAALATMVADGDPATVLCSPRAAASADALSVVVQQAGHQHCVCASGGDTVPPTSAIAGDVRPALLSILHFSAASPPEVAAVRLPPACGPPA